jgi:hypothetical protein
MLTKETSDARLKIALERNADYPFFLKAINEKKKSN